MEYLILFLVISFIAYKIATNKRSDRKDSIDIFDEKTRGLKYRFRRGASGIALKDSEGSIVLFSGEKVKEYKFSDIRSWKYELNTYTKGDTYRGTGLVGIAATASAISKQKDFVNKCEETSGFFVTVRDIDNPLWRIYMGDPNSDETKINCERWMEIFRQYVNENKTQESAA